MASTNRDEISRLELLHAAHPDGLVFPHLADAYRRAGRYSQAESVLKAGLRRHADYSSAHIVLGRLRLDQGKRREAESAFQRVLQLEPRNPAALELLGRLAAEEGRAEEAVSYLRRLAAEKPSSELTDRIAQLERRAAEARTARGGASADASGDARGAGLESATGAGGRTGPAGVTGANGGGRSPGGEGDAALPGLPEPGEVVTETMAELYTRQGLHERAAAVYRQLLDRDPGNPRLEAKLRAAADRGRRESPGGSASELTHAPASPGSRPADPPARARERGGDSMRVADAGPGDGGWADPAPPFVPGRVAPVPEPGIRDYLAGVLSWSPDGHGESGGQPERDRSDAGTWGPATEVARGPEPDVAGPERDPPEKESLPDFGQDASLRREAARWRPPAPGGSRVGPRPQWGPTPPLAELDLQQADLTGADAQTRALVGLTDILVGLLEYRDPFFRGSSSLTRLLATNVAGELGLETSETVDLALAAVLRDLGRLAMGGRLVESPKFSETPEGRRKIERHVDLALQLMEGITLPERVILAVRHHHERWDGAGYPSGLAGEEIPKLARILAVVDSFAAMVSSRPYRLPRKVPAAARELQEAAGTQYDPTVVDALLQVVARRDQPHLGFVQRHHILMVNPDHPGGVVTAAKLCSAGYLAEVAVDPDAARERLRRVPVSALVISAETGPEAAETLIHDLRLDPLFASLPIVVVDAETVALRVRLLEGGADVCFPAGVSYGELQGTLGALVRRTVRSRETPAADGEEAPWLALQGDVQDFPLAWLLQVMKYDSRTAGVGIRTATEQGAIYIEQGDAVHAQIRGGAKGEAALKEMLHWRKGRFTVQPDARPRERSIEASIMHLLLTQAVEEDHAAAGIFGAVPDHG